MNLDEPTFEREANKLLAQADAYRDLSSSLTMMSAAQTVGARPPFDRLLHWWAKASRSGTLQSSAPLK